MRSKSMILMLIIILFIPFSASGMEFIPEDVYNSVVVVYTQSGLGSGFAVDTNTIITNAHVVQNYSKVNIKYYDNTMTNGTVINKDEEKDLALIHVETELKPLNLSHDELHTGQEVYAIGAPSDIPYTMTKGIISAVSREIEGRKYIQLDASVNSGNSGGPLVDNSGNVVGLITMKLTDAEGIGFAINCTDIEEFINGKSDNVSEQDENAKTYENDEQTNEEIQRLKKSNEILKMVVIILSLIVVFLIILLLKSRNKKTKKKDDFDFEIEILED